MEEHTTNFYEIISVIPVELFSNENLEILQANLKKLEEEDQAKLLSSPDEPERKVHDDRGSEKIAYSFKEFCIYEYYLYSLEDTKLFNKLSYLNECKEIEFILEKSKILLALQKDGTSLCLAIIFHFERQSNDTSAVITELKELREKWKGHFDENYNSRKSDSTETNKLKLLKDISPNFYDKLENIPIFASNLEYFDYHFTFFGLSDADMANEELYKNLFENEVTQKLIEKNQSIFICDWSTLVLYTAGESYYEEINRVIAMEILAQLLWNKYNEFSKLVSHLIKDGMSFLKLDKKTLFLDPEDIDSQLNTMPENIYSVMSAYISRQNIEMLEAISETIRLKFAVEKMIANRSTLRHLRYADYEVAELKSRATIQWLLIFLGLFGVTEAIFAFKWIRLRGDALSISLISIATVIIVLFTLILIQRYKIRKKINYRFMLN